MTAKIRTQRLTGKVKDICEREQERQEEQTQKGRNKKEQCDNLETPRLTDVFQKTR